MTLRIENSLNLGAILREVDEVTPDALQAAADHVKEVAASRAPLLTGEALHKANDERRTDPGALRRSAYARLDGDKAEVGFTEFYAGWQHERMDYRHEDGEAKFLERTLASEVRAALRIIADKLRERLGS